MHTSHERVLAVDLGFDLFLSNLCNKFGFVIFCFLADTRKLIFLFLPETQGHGVSNHNSNASLALSSYAILSKRT